MILYTRAYCTCTYVAPKGVVYTTHVISARASYIPVNTCIHVHTCMYMNTSSWTSFMHYGTICVAKWFYKLLHLTKLNMDNDHMYMNYIYLHERNSPFLKS